MDSSNALQNDGTQSSVDCQPEQAGPQHEWLQQLVGEWTAEMSMTMGPDQPPMTSSGRETVTTLGGLWTIGEGSGDTPDGQNMNSIMTLGYDPKQQAYVGTFVASMMTYMWHYKGQRSGNTLTLDTVGPDMSPGAEPGAMAEYQDIIEIVSPDERKLRSQAKGADGQWFQFMEATYRRVK
jgi:hypothetical protein